jgi:hypothetical protein
MTYTIGQIWTRKEPQNDDFDVIEVVGSQRFEKEAPAEVVVRPVPFGDTVSATPESLHAAYTLTKDATPVKESLETGQSWL